MTYKLLPAAPSMGFKRERTKIAERARRNILLYENSKHKYIIKQIYISEFFSNVAMMMMRLSFARKTEQRIRLKN